MVRYPKKKLQLEAPQIKEEPLVISSSVPPIMDEVVLPKKEQDGQVKELQERIHSLEEKLKDIKEHEQVLPKASKLRFQLPEIHLGKIKKYICAGLLIAVLGGLIWLVCSHLWLATMTLVVEPKEFRVQGVSIKLDIKEQYRLAAPPGILQEAAHFYKMMVVLGNDQKSFQVKVFALDQAHALLIVNNWEKNYRQKYEENRRNRLNQLLANIDKAYQGTCAQLEDVFTKMALFQPNEHIFIVNSSIKARFNQLAVQDSLNLEKDLANGKLLLASLNKNVPVGFSSIAAKSMLNAYRLKLTELEFKKFLIGKESVNLYEQGMKHVKSGAVRLINEATKKQRMDSIATALNIKRFFLECQMDAIIIILNKRYAVADELSGNLTKYVQLKLEFDRLYSAAADLLLNRDRIKHVLDKGIAFEIGVKTAAMARKY